DLVTGVKDLFLVLDVVVESRLGDTEFRRDVVKRGVVEPARTKGSRRLADQGSPLCCELVVATLAGVFPGVSPPRSCRQCCLPSPSDYQKRQTQTIRSGFDPVHIDVLKKRLRTLR